MRSGHSLSLQTQELSGDSATRYTQKVKGNSLGTATPCCLHDSAGHRGLEEAGGASRTQPTGPMLQQESRWLIYHNTKAAPTRRRLLAAWIRCNSRAELLGASPGTK